MNPSEPLHPAEACLHRVIDRVDQYVREEPAKAVAAAFCAGLLLKLLPARTVARPVAALTVKLLPPALLGLGMIKAFEMCSAKHSCGASDAPADGPAAITSQALRRHAPSRQH
jgi:hypothetical protein